MNPNEIMKAVDSGEMNVADALTAMEDWRNQGEWVPASNRTETPFWTRTGRRLLYVYQSRTGRHAYLDVQTDLVLTDEEAAMAMGI